jgi:hypothetical protein
MKEGSTVVRLHQPDVLDDPLTEILRAGARRLLAQAVEQEAEAFLAGGPALGSAFASPRPLCRCGRGGPRAWMRCCRCFICAGFRRAIFRRRCRLCWGRTRLAYRPR